DARHRCGDVGGVRLDALPSRAAQRWPVSRLETEPALLLVALLHHASGRLSDREAVLEREPPRVHDQRQVAAIERQVRVRQRAEEAARGIERYPLAAHPRLDPRLGGALLRLVPETE